MCMHLTSASAGLLTDAQALNSSQAAGGEAADDDVAADEEGT